MNPVKLQNRYNRIAAYYDEMASLYQYMGEQLLQNLQTIEIHPKRIIDLGCGTGNFTAKLAELYPEAKVVGVDFSENMLTVAKEKFPNLNFITADIVAFNLSRCDLIFCNAVMLGSMQPNALFKAAKNLLTENGLFLFSSIGPDTLAELKNVWLSINKHVPINEFIDMHHLGDMLKAMHFIDPVLSTEKLTIDIPDVMTLLHSIQAMGDSYLGEVEFLSRKDLQKLTTVYPDNGNNLSVTFEVIYGYAKQADNLSLFSADESGEVRIPLSHLKRRN